jgi:hypothetical protein
MESPQRFFANRAFRSLVINKQVLDPLAFGADEVTGFARHATTHIFVFTAGITYSFGHIDSSPFCTLPSSR